MKKVLALDIGGTNIKAAFFVNDKITKNKVYKTKVNKFQELLLSIIQDSYWPSYNIVSIATPGFIDHNKQIIVLSGNLKLKNYPIKKIIEELLPNKEVFVLNDANAAALGEKWVNYHKYKNIIFYTIGTGLGGGLIIDNKLITGPHGFAGEFGHGGFFQSELKCTCGLKYCLEPFSSASGIKSLLKKNNLNYTFDQVVQLFKSKNETIIKILKKAFKPLAEHMAIMISAINPEAIIIGGGVSYLGYSLVSLLKELMRQKQHLFMLKTCKIKLAKLGNKAGVYGSYYFAIQNSKNIIK